MIRQNNGVREFLFFASLKSYDYFGEENAYFFNSQTSCQKPSDRNMALKNDTLTQCAIVSTSFQP